MRPARIIVIQVVLMLGVVGSKCGCAKIARYCDKKIEKTQTIREARIVKQRSQKMKRESNKIHKANDKNQFKVPKSLKAGTDMITIMMYNEDDNGTNTVNVQLKVPTFLLPNRLFSFS